MISFAKIIILVVIGISGGGSVGVGAAAFFSKIGVVPRLATRTCTVKYIKLFEVMIMLGIIGGNILSIYKYQIHTGLGGVLIYGLFSGIYVGCLIIALTEVFSAIPIMIRRIGIVTGIKWIVVVMALGKMTGSFIQYFFKIGI